MASFTVIYDACALYSMHARDILMQLACTGLFRARWTEKIQDEWSENLLKNRPDLDRKKLKRTRELMNLGVRDCLVEGYEPIIDGLELPDPDDRHVLAAAIKAGADAIVTYNLKDFPQEILDRYGIESQHPDVFLTHTLDLNKGRVCEAVKKCRLRNHAPPFEVDEYLKLLEKQELNQFVSDLKEFSEIL